MRYYTSKGLLAGAPFPIKIISYSCPVGIVALLMWMLFDVISFGIPELDAWCARVSTGFGGIALAVLAAIAICVLVLIKAPDKTKITWRICYRLANPAFGNSLGLHAGQRIPRVWTSDVDGGYEIHLLTHTVSPESIEMLTRTLSAALIGKYGHYAVGDVVNDPAERYVTFRIEDVLENRSLHCRSLSELRTDAPWFIKVQKGFL